MLLRLFKCACKNCGIVFKFPSLSGDTYDECILIDKYSDMVYSNSFKDLVFDEFSRIFDSCVIEKDQNNLDLFLPVLSATCDLSPNNKAYQVRKPHCPTSHKSDFNFFSPTNPSENV